MSEGGRTPWNMATAKGWRRSIRSMLAHVQPLPWLELVKSTGTGSGAGQRFGVAPAVNEQVRQSGGGDLNLEAVLAGRVEVGVATPSVNDAANEQHEQPATSGTEE